MVAANSSKSRALTVALFLDAQPIIGGVNLWTEPGPEGGSISCVVVDPGNTNRLYLGSVGAGIFKSVDCGRSWAAASAGLPGGWVHSLALDRSDGLSYAEIAELCRISYHTVHTHVKAIQVKAGVSSTVRLLAMIHAEGWDR